MFSIRVGDGSTHGDGSLQDKSNNLVLNLLDQSLCILVAASQAVIAAARLEMDEKRVVERKGRVPLQSCMGLVGSKLDSATQP